jgi:hypothetical protein
VYKGNKIQEKYFRGLSIDELVAGFTTQNNKLLPARPGEQRGGGEQAEWRDAAEGQLPGVW